MTTGCQTYEQTDTSSLGALPANWDVQRLKTLAKYWVSNVDKVSSEDELPVRLCNYTDVYNNREIHPDLPLMRTTATAEEIAKFGLKVGDVVITKDSEDWTDIAVPALVTGTAADFVCGYHLAIIRADRRKLDSRFLLRLLQASPINYHFQVAATGVTRYGLPKSAIGETRLPVLPLEEQCRIADFLDREIASIDQLIEKKSGSLNSLRRTGVPSSQLP